MSGLAGGCPTKAARKMYCDTPSTNFSSQASTSSLTSPFAMAVSEKLSTADSKPPPSISDTIQRIQKNIRENYVKKECKKEQEKEKGKKRKKSSNGSAEQVPAHLLNHSYAKTYTSNQCTQPTQSNYYLFDPSILQPSNYISMSNHLHSIATTSNGTNNDANNPLSLLPQQHQVVSPFNQQANTFSHSHPLSHYNQSQQTANASASQQSLSNTINYQMQNLPQQTNLVLNHVLVNSYMKPEVIYNPPQIQPFLAQPKSDPHLLHSPPSLTSIGELNSKRNSFSGNLPSCTPGSSVSSQYPNVSDLPQLPKLIDFPKYDDQQKSFCKQVSTVEKSTSTDDLLLLKPFFPTSSKSKESSKLLKKFSSWFPQFGPFTGPVGAIREEIEFNIYMSTIEPHCAICTLLKPYQIDPNFRIDQLDQWCPPKSSSVEIPSVAFTSKVSDPSTVIDSRETSPLLVCMDCRVCVHQVCYGVVDMLHFGSENNWKCDRCAKEDYFASCSLCPLLGGPLKEAINSNDSKSPKTSDSESNMKSKSCSTSGKWAHVVCALLVPDVKFVNGITKKPVDLGALKIVKNEKGCVYCKMNYPDNELANYFVGYCVQCDKIAHCTTMFHVTCGHRQGAIYKPSDWPYPVTITCQRCAQKEQSKQIENRSNLIDVSVQTKVIARHKNSRYYWAKIIDKWEQVFHHVHFVDNSFTEVLKSVDFLSHDMESKPPETGDSVEVVWNKDQLSGKYTGNHSCTLYKIEFDDGSQINNIKREDFYLKDEELPKKVQMKMSSSSDKKH